MPNTVSDQITDSVTQANTTVLGQAPAQALGTLYQTAAAASGLALQNAVHAQQNQYAMSNAVAVGGINQLFSSPTAASAAASTKIDAGFEGILTKLGTLLTDRQGGGSR
ncbi:MAG: RebB family R body protein [Myxococcales bacterium]|nr:RebB family R body protein [Myxococcales bacterium]